MAGSENQGAETPRKLAPEMASFRLLVLAFVREYIGAMGQSPSYGEISARLRSNRTRVRNAVKRLVAEGLLMRVPGPRGLKLPSMREEAIRQLREMGWLIVEEHLQALPPGFGGVVTKGALLDEPPLDYTPPGRLGPSGGPDGKEEGKAGRKAG